MTTGGTGRSNIFPQRHEAAIYRCTELWMTKPFFEEIRFGFAVERPKARGRGTEKQYRLVGLWGLPGNPWPVDLSPQQKKDGSIRRRSVSIREELRRALAAAICAKLEVPAEEVASLRHVVDSHTKERYGATPRRQGDGA